MKWRKIVKYALILWALLTVITYYLANRNVIRMYGGMTEEVDVTQFLIEATPFVIKNINVLSEDGNRFQANSYVTVENELITSVDSVLRNPQKIKEIDGSNKFLIPGLTDAHVHLFKSPNDLLLYIANGITQIRELIGEEVHLQWRKEINEGRLGPDMYISSPRLGSFGLVEGWWMSWSQGFDNIRNSNDAEKSVQRYYEQGYDGVKIYSQLSPESYAAVCEKADEVGLGVMGHIPFSVSLAEVYASEQSEISHFEEIMNALNREFGYYNWENTEEFFEFLKTRSSEVADELLANNIYVTTTLFGTENTVANKFDLENQLRKSELEYVNPGLVEWSSLAPGGLGWLPEVSRHKLPDNLNEEQIAGRRLHWETYQLAEEIVATTLIKKGVKLMAGTDANIPLKVPGFSLHDEFISLKNAGMSPIQILKSATIVPSEWMETNAGYIAAGRKANLVLLEENPLIDINNTRSIYAVIKDGKIYDKATLDSILQSVKEANDRSRKKDISKYGL